MTKRKKGPVFVVGCHRSGTSYLYHCLLSAGGFAIYRSDTCVWDRLIPLFGGFGVRKNRERMMEVWLRSKPFRRTGLDAEQIEAKVLSECRSGGDFLRIVMEEVARSQNVDRWAAWDPDNTYYMQEIKKELPDALFIHIIRDGRDIATVLDNKKWIKPFPWDREKSLEVAGVFWEFMVRKGREFGRQIKEDYTEVRYEDLVTRPHETFAKLGTFIDHDLDYDLILRTGVGAVADPNSTFKKEFVNGQFNPVGRWKEKLSSERVAALEQVIGGLLEELEYPPATAGLQRNSLRSKILRTLYLSHFEFKLWLKNNTPAGRFASTEPLELSESSETVKGSARISDTLDKQETFKPMNRDLVEK